MHDSEGHSGTTSEPYLTPTEEMVARLIAESKTNREIAEQLEVSQRAVKYHVSNTLRKLEFRNRAQIAVWYKTR